MAKKDTAKAKQKIRDYYNPRITDFRDDRDALVTKIEKLKQNKIFVDQHLVSFDTLCENYDKTMEAADTNLRETKSLKGNFMTTIEENMFKILDNDWKTNVIMVDCQYRMQDGQKKLDEKIEDLQADLTSVQNKIKLEIWSRDFELQMADW